MTAPLQLSRATPAAAPLRLFTARVLASPAVSVNENKSGVGFGGENKVLWPLPTKAFGPLLKANNRRSGPCVPGPLTPTGALAPLLPAAAAASRAREFDLNPPSRNQ